MPESKKVVLTILLVVGIGTALFFTYKFISTRSSAQLAAANANADQYKGIV